MPDTIITTKTPRVVNDLIDSLGEVLSGDKPDLHGVKEAFWSAFAHSLATSVHKAFLIKSAHGTDELGQKWPDLDPKTKAYSRPEARKGLPLPGPKSRPTLTTEQDKEWRRIYATRLAWLRTQGTEAEAKTHAAAIAWNYVKKELGATTILAFAKDQILLLLQRSGSLEKSLRPGSFSGEKYNPPDGQIFKIEKSGLTWGSSIEYASRVDKKRPLWPKNIDPWITRAINSGIEAVVIRIKNAL